MSLLKDKAAKFSDKFTSKVGKLIAFWTAMAFLISILPLIVSALIFLYFLIVDLYNISTYVKEFRASAEYSYFLDMEEVSALHEEMETIIMYGVELQKTNDGDLWYFTTTMINGNVRPIFYSANVKRKGKMVLFPDGRKLKCHVYIQNMKGLHQWIPDDTQHYHDQ
jgi:hypothetical protein